eukprot:g37710.t1
MLDKVAEEHLWDYLDLMDWIVFKSSEENLDEYATTIMDLISKCVEDCMPKKSICVFPIWKSQMNWENHSLLKTNDAAFKLDNQVENPDMTSTKPSEMPRGSTRP